MYREDYRRGGIVFLPVVEPDGRSTARQMLVGVLMLVPASLLPAYLSMAGRLYGIGALALGRGFVYATLCVARERTVARARGVLQTSVVYLPLLYGLMLADSTLTSMLVLCQRWASIQRRVNTMAGAGNSTRRILPAGMVRTFRLQRQTANGDPTASTGYLRTV